MSFILSLYFKMSFEDNIKEWVALDNQLKVYNDKIREIKEKRTRLSDKIVGGDNFDSHLCNKTLQISDGKLKFANTKVTAPLTFKYVQSSLSNIIRNETQVAQIIQYLKEHREIKMVPEIKRYS